MTTRPTGTVAEIEATARAAGLGDLQVRRGRGSGGSGTVLGVLMALAGVGLVGVCAAGLAGEVIPVLGVIGMLLALLIVYIARGAKGSLKQFLVLFAVAALLGVLSFLAASVDEDSPAAVAYGLVMAAALLAGGASVVRRAKTAPARVAESLSLFDGGIVYVSPDLDGGRPIAFPWDQTAVEEAIAPVRGRLIHTLTFRRSDGYGVTQTFNPTLRADGRLLRRVQEVMAANQVGPIVEQLRVGQTVTLGGALWGTSEALGLPSADGSQNPTDALRWRDIKGYAFSDQSFIITGKRGRTLQVPASEVRDVGVLKAVVTAMAKGEPAPAQPEVKGLGR